MGRCDVSGDVPYVLGVLQDGPVTGKLAHRSNVPQTHLQPALLVLQKKKNNTYPHVLAMSAHVHMRDRTSGDAGY